MLRHLIPNTDENIRIVGGEFENPPREIRIQLSANE